MSIEKQAGERPVENYFYMIKKTCKDCKDSINFFIYFLLQFMDQETCSPTEDVIVIIEITVRKEDWDSETPKKSNMVFRVIVEENNFIDGTPIYEIHKPRRQT